MKMTMKMTMKKVMKGVTDKGLYFVVKSVVKMVT